jgi:hypothetical protein
VTDIAAEGTSMNDFLILLENAAAAGWIALCVVAAISVGLLVHDLLQSRSSSQKREEQERKAA